MKKFYVPFMVFTVLATLAIPLTASADNDREQSNRLVLNLVGEAPMYERMVPDIDGDGNEDPAICFDATLINGKNRQRIGTATDCLSNITPVGTGLGITATTFFHLPQGNLIVRGGTSVQPVVLPTVTPGGHLITHITGAASTGNPIIEGTKRFQRTTGKVRLSGMVDMTHFAGKVGDPIFFDCLFIVDLD